MKKWIRWQGCVAFIGIAAVIAVVFLFFADGMIKRAIESVGTKTVGAEVDVADVDLSLSPAGLEIKGLQVTNPDEPMQNAVQVARIHFSMDSLNLLRKKVIIDDMAVEGVEFNTQRKKAGWVAPAKKEQAEKTETSESETEAEKKSILPSLDIKDIQSILSKEKLMSLEEIDAFKAEISKEKETFDVRIKSLPDKEKFDEYKVRVKKLKESKKGLEGILGFASEASALKKDIDKDLKEIKKTKKELEQSIKDLKSRFKEVSQSPLKDIKRIRDKYSLSPEGIGNMMETLAGPVYAKWVKTSLKWYAKLKPMIEKQREKKGKAEVAKPLRGKGVNIRFAEHNPMPDFLVKNTDVSVRIPAGDMAGKITNITDAQDILGKPTTCEFSGKELKGINSVTINGVFNHVVPEKSKDTLHMIVSGYLVDKLSLSNSPEIPLTIQNGNVDVQADASLASGNIDSTVSMSMKSARFVTSEKENAGRIAKAVQAALSDVSEFNIRANIKGTFEKQEIKISSDLDKVMKNAVGKIVEQAAAEFENNLKEAVLEKTSGKLDSLKDSLGALNSIDSDLAGRLDTGENLLKTIGK